MTDNSSHTHNWIWSDGENGRRSACVGCPETRDGWLTGSGEPADTDLEAQKVRRSITVTYLDGTIEDIPEIPDDEIATAIWAEIVMHEHVREAVLYRADGTEASRYRLAVNSASQPCEECGCTPGHQRSCSKGRERAVPRIPAPRTEPCGTTCHDGSVAPWTELHPVICGHVSRVFGTACQHPVPGHDGDHCSTAVPSDRSYAWDDTH